MAAPTRRKSVTVGPVSKEEKGMTQLVDEKNRFVLDMQRQNELAHEQCEGNMDRLIHGLRAEGAARDMCYDGLSEMMQSVKQRTGDAVRCEYTGRGTMETELQRVMLEKAAESVGNLEETTKWNEAEREHAQAISDEVCHLYKALDEERRLRTERGRELAQAVRHKLHEVRDAVDAERRLRVESRDTILELLGQMGGKVQSILQAARADRMNTSERIFSVMEVVVPKIDAASRAKTVTQNSDLSTADSKTLASTMDQNLKRRRSVIEMGGAAVLFKTGNADNITRRSSAVVSNEQVEALSRR